MKILILGSNSQISKSIKKNKYKIQNMGYEFYFLDRRIVSDTKIKSKILEINPKCIINSIVYHPVDECEKNKIISKKINVLFVKKVISLLSSINKKIIFIHFSSDYVFDGNNPDNKYFDNSKRKPINTLGLHKKMAEDLLINKYKYSIILRISWLFSEFNDNFVIKIYKKLSKNENIQVVSDQFGNPTSADSLVNFIFKYLLNKKDQNIHKKIYNFCNYPSVSWHIFAETIFNIMFREGLIKKNIYVDEIKLLDLKKLNYKAKRPINTSLEIENIKKYFKNYSQVYWYNELEKVIKLLKNNVK